MSSRQWRAARKKKLKEAVVLEKEIGWAPGTLSNPDGWPDPPPRPLTKAEKKRLEADRRAERAADQARWAAEENARLVAIGEALYDLLAQCTIVNPDQYADLGKEAESVLEAAGFFVVREEYDD